MKHKHCLFTNDVETTSIWHNELRGDTGIKVIKEGMPILLDIYEEFKVHSTFFFVADFAGKHPEVVKMILSKGHEVASHGLTHDPNMAFDIMDFSQQLDHLKKSKKILEDISGEEVISFRAPALRVNKHTGPALTEAGYKIDSSVASQRFDFFLSFGSKKKLNWLLAPRKPYKTKPDNLFKKGDGVIAEVPLSALIFPYLGTTMRIFPMLTSLQRKIMAFESKINGKPIVFDIHPNEFISEHEVNRIIKRRAKNPVSYFLQDWLRSKLKTKNLGEKAVPLYSRQLSFFNKRGFEFNTMKEYCQKKELI